ncbi:spag1 axonemal dynein assembly factor isoform X2 [Nomia melanderi]|uniref:spag1 axonemal dynein assembly factor isoform X2 n=1 Tax=Nomia melanderi TaxID=2448451 RepID=UPI0013046A31|nr:sperm-associated antigen 1 isoform X2 [Nomia melanderi]
MGENDTEFVHVAKHGKKSLLERYDIPVEHLSYEYISECTDAKKLERIVIILRSGEEGFYPDLTRHAEERLAVVKPTSIILRKSEPILTRNVLDPNDCKEIDTDINRWMSEMQSREKDLEEGKSTVITEPILQPDIRQFKENLAKKNTITHSKTSNKTKRISSCDYAAWDRYDVDTELSKIDIRDEQKRTEAKRFQQKQKESFQKKTLDKETILNKSSLTGTELNVMADQERGKGNEAFKVGDYEEALEHYNTSIKIDSAITTYNNRAITFIKLGRYENALKDCNFVLSADCMNIKALLRRAVALEHLEKSSEALADYETVLKLEPTNSSAIAGVNKLRKPCDSKKVRMVIVEQNETGDEGTQNKKTEENNNYNKQSESKVNIESSICYCDRAPGPSKNLRPRPHFKGDYCLENDNKQKVLVETNVSKRPELNKNLIDKVYNSTQRNTNSPSFENPKSIFSYPMPSKRSSSVIIEELPSEFSNNNPKENKSISNGTSLNKNNFNKNSNKTSETNKLNVEKSNENCKLDVASTPRKIQDDKYERKTCKSEKYISKNFSTIETSYEFMRIWQSLKNDDLEIHAQLLRSLNVDKLVLGNELEGNMFSTILQCLERHFCTPNDTKLLNNFLKSFSEVKRFSIMNMFMNPEDKRAMKNILNFLEEHGTSEVSSLRRIYCI